MKSLTKNWKARNLKSKRPAPYDREFTEKELEVLEQEFIDTYARSNIKPLRMMLKIYARYWKDLLISLLFYVIKHSPAILLPIVTSHIINFVAYPGQYSLASVIIYASVLVALVLLNVPMHTLFTKYYSKVMRKVEAGLRGAMVRKLQHLSISFHKEMQSGRIQSKLMRDVETIHTLSVQLFTTLPAIIINVVSSLVIVVSHNLGVFAFFVLCIPSSVIIVKIFRKRMENVNKDYRVNMESTSSKIMDMVEMTEITRAHALEDREIKKISNSLTNVARVGLRVDIVQNVFSALSWATFQIFQLGCLIFTSVLAYNKIIPVGDISLYQSYFISITGQVSSLIGLLPIITKGLDSVSSIGEILSATDIEDNTDKIHMNELRGDYEFKNVVFSYGEDQRILQDLCIDVKAGETVAFVGVS